MIISCGKTIVNDESNIENSQYPALQADIGFFPHQTAHSALLCNCASDSVPRCGWCYPAARPARPAARPYQPIHGVCRAIPGVCVFFTRFSPVYPANSIVFQKNQIVKLFTEVLKTVGFLLKRLLIF